MKLLSKILVLLALCSWAVPGLAQTSGIINGATPIVGGTTGQCVTKAANGTVLMASCAGASVSTFSAGTTGLTPNSATSGAVTLAGTLLGLAGGTGVNNAGKTITLGGNLTTSGAFATTFTSTATTSVTLPTTGTLATLAGSEALTNKTYNGQTITAGSGTLTLGSVTLNAGAGGTLGSNAFTSTAYAPLASPTFTGTVTIPTPFTLGAVSVTATGTQLNYLNAATGTTGTTSSSVVFSASPTFTGTVTHPTPFTLGATSVTTTGTQLNYLNAATGTTGTTSTNVVFSTSPTLVTPVLGAATGTSLALGGATLGSNVFSGIGTAILTGATTTGPDWEVWITGDTFARAAVGVNAVDGARLSLGPGNAARDVFIERAGAANKRSGGPDAAAPIAQIDSVQNVVVGTSNTAGAARSYYGSQSTGTGLGGSHQWYVSPAGSTGTAVNALALALTIDSTKLLTVPGAIAIGGATIGGNALAVTGTANVSSTVTAGGNFLAPAGGLNTPSYTFTGFSTTGLAKSVVNGFHAVSITSAGADQWAVLQSGVGTYQIGPLSFTTSLASAPDTIIGRRAAANLNLGAADAAAPVAQTLSVQGVVAGTSNTAGALWRFDDSAGTGSAASGGFDWYTHPLGGSGTAQNAAVRMMGLSSGGILSFPTAGSAGTAILIGTSGSGVTLIGNGTELILGNGASTQTGSLFVGGNQRLSSTSNLSWNNNAANISYITTGTLGIGTGAQGSIAGTLQLATLTASGTIATGAPAGASAGLWKLGSLVTAAVVVDTTRSIFVDIGGTVYKLMVAQ